MTKGILKREAMGPQGTRYYVEEEPVATTFEEVMIGGKRNMVPVMTPLRIHYLEHDYPNCRFVAKDGEANLEAKLIGGTLYYLNDKPVALGSEVTILDDSGVK